MGTAIAARLGSRPARALHVWLWIAQGLLAVLFGVGGLIKLILPIPELAEAFRWPGDMPPAVVRFIGVSELAGALGLVLPAGTRIAPVLTPVAASGLVLVMLLASFFHVARGELHLLPINALIGAAAWFVAWGRFMKAPITSH